MNMRRVCQEICTYPKSTDNLTHGMLVKNRTCYAIHHNMQHHLPLLRGCSPSWYRPTNLTPHKRKNGAKIAGTQPKTSPLKNWERPRTSLAYRPSLVPPYLVN
ncbi:hypothetical protein TNIN_451991 [Trichonephila inaurata madagascariensis]|uniref:Uncharacterized protein n=1 Tax=Trichonephila inaurata madagascariensis TaxID=2747483 RepID=A0A8X6YDD6_9ARAC|nr:hypothetical protein TNIN_451991 [Trichonephila inaurata madagascariensis]